MEWRSRKLAGAGGRGTEGDWSVPLHVPQLILSSSAKYNNRFFIDGGNNTLIEIITRPCEVSMYNV